MRTAWRRLTLIAARVALFAGVALAEESPPPAAISPGTAAPDEARGENAMVANQHQRLYAIQIGAVPSLVLDVQYKYLYAFVNSPSALAALAVFVPTAGVGASIPVGARKRLRLDILAFGGVLVATTISRDQGPITSVDGGFGLAIGLHYTWPNGLTLGTKLPVTGYITGAGDVKSGFAAFYGLGLLGLPLGSIGYRF